MGRLLCLLVVAAALAACGGGNIGDLFGLFPAEVFQPPADGDDGGGGGGGGPPSGGAQITEVAYVESAQKVTGDVRNIALAQVGALNIAFLSAGSEGIHLVDVTQPERAQSNYITTIRDAVLGSSSASLAGGRSDALAVVDNTYLVSAAVGTGAPNAVSVFHIPTLIQRAASPTSDLSDAFVPKTDGPDIAVPGVAGKGGGIAGRASTFLVATGGPELGLGAILPGTPGSWASAGAFTSGASPKIDRFIDVLFTLNGVFTSVQSGDTYGLVAMGITGANPPTITIVTPEAVDVEDRTNGGDFALLLTRDIVGPGTFPMDLALDTLSLFVTGDAEVRIFNVSNPALNTPPTIVPNTGQDTISVDARGGFFAVGANSFVRIYSIVTGQAVPVGSFEFTAVRMKIRGVALTTSSGGRFLLCCAGERGLRVLQWSAIP